MDGSPEPLTTRKPKPKLISARELIDVRLGRPKVMSACGVKTQAITNWIRDDAIPTRHYLAFQRLCRAAEIPVPNHLFFGRAAA